MDEPTSNLDPIGRYEFLNIIREVSGRSAVLLSSHILGEVEQVCDHLVFLNEGTVIYKGRWNELKSEFPGLSLQDIFIRLVKGEDG